MELRGHESLICQWLATISLIETLDGLNFLNSEYYKENVVFNVNNDIIKEILDKSRLGNPATFQMFFYMLLVMPKEIIEETTITSWEVEFKRDINSYSLDVTTTYPDESAEDSTSIQYFRHIRNSISHSKCTYVEKNNKQYVIFKDENPGNNSQRCEIKMPTSDAGRIMEFLYQKMMIYLNNRWKNR